jgi:phosphatidylglycerophosphate synthase
MRINNKEDLPTTYVFRPLSKIIVRRLYHIKSLKPNHITLLSFFSIAIAFLILTNFINTTTKEAAIIISCLFIFLHYLFDCIDGDLAKAKFMCTREGDWLDGITDRIGDFLTFVAIGALVNTMLGWKLILVIITSILLTVLSSMSIKNPYELVGAGKEQIVNDAKSIINQNKLFKLLNKLGLIPTDFIFGKGIRTFLVILGLLSSQLMLLLYLLAICQAGFLVVTAIIIWRILENER